MDNIVTFVYGFAKIFTFIFLIGFPVLVVRRMNNRKQQKVKMSARFAKRRSSIEPTDYTDYEVPKSLGMKVQGWFSRRRGNIKTRHKINKNLPHR